MKNIYLFLVGSLLFSISAGAQITLTSAGYPASVLGIDTLMVTKAVSAFPVLTHATGVNWDMSVVTDSPVVLFDHRVAAAPYQYADSNEYSFGGYSYQGNVLYNITASGILEYGIKIGRSAHRLPNPPFANPLDSIIFDLQAMLYSAPRTQVALPATYLDNWSSTFQSDFNFHITAIEIGYAAGTPGIVRTFTVEHDTVVGWGNMRTKNPDGSAGPYIPVLQVQSTIIHTDSFFIGGVIPSVAVLTTFGITEGQKDTTYEQSYYRTGDVAPVAIVDFNDPGYTQPYTATTKVHPDVSLAISNRVVQKAVKVYPNPVTGNLVSLELPATGGSWAYELTDITGKKVAESTLPVNGTHAQITLPEMLPAGVYHLRLVNDGKQFCITSIDVTR